MMTNITQTRPSTFWPNSIFSDPTCSQVTDAWLVSPLEAYWISIATDRTSAIAMAAIPISAPFPGVRLPKNRITKKATATSEGTTHAYWITRAPRPGGPRRSSPFQQAHLVDVDRLAVPVDEDDDGQADP